MPYIHNSLAQVCIKRWSFLQTAYSQITLAFRCDQYTLKQRLQAEEHARNLAEENVQLELTRGRETLEVRDTCDVGPSARGSSPECVCVSFRH